MAHLTIDQEKCVKCNRCVQDCPMGIPMRDAEGNYCSNEENAQVCIYCGHCVTVCPTGAVTLHKNENEAIAPILEDYGIVPLEMTPEDRIPTEIGKKPAPEQLEALIRSRRMTRSFMRRSSSTP